LIDRAAFKNDWQNGLEFVYRSSHKHSLTCQYNECVSEYNATGL